MKAPLCRLLRDRAESHRAEKGKDCLYIFLQIHYCICTSVESGSYGSELKDVNARFVEQGLRIYDNFRSLNVSPRQISDRWAIALASYCRRPHSYLFVLPRMAIAHILDDLPDSLFGVAVGERDYRRVFEVIFACLKRILRENIKKSSLEFAFTNIVSKGIVAALRRRAWNNVQNRHKLVASIESLWQKEVLEQLEE